MKTDKELLELAEKAAKSASKNILTIGCPLTDDGDALRLAVALVMAIDCQGSSTHAESYGETFIEYNNGDQMAATRRAIVRAAAAIGERL